MRISDWSSDVCSSDLGAGPGCARPKPGRASRDDTLTIDASQGGFMNGQTAILAAGIALLALAQTHAAHAAEAAQSASEDGAGAEGSGDIIVTAQKKSESIREVPATLLGKVGDPHIAADRRVHS